LDGSEFVIEFRPEARHYRDTLAKPENATALREACSEVCGREVGIRFAIKEEKATPDQAVPPEEEQRRTEEKARQAIAQHPSVQQALRAFGGQIVDIKLR
jgi:DNA polymerase-3 subunit gamma/tau